MNVAQTPGSARSPEVNAKSFCGEAAGRGGSRASTRALVRWNETKARVPKPRIEEKLAWVSTVPHLRAVGKCITQNLT